MWLVKVICEDGFKDRWARNNDRIYFQTIPRSPFLFEELDTTILDDTTTVKDMISGYVFLLRFTSFTSRCNGILYRRNKDCLKKYKIYKIFLHTLTENTCKVLKNWFFFFFFSLFCHHFEYLWLLPTPWVVLWNHTFLVFKWKWSPNYTFYSIRPGKAVQCLLCFGF